MSGTIGKYKMRFSLFGRGYDDERSDSGTGEIPDVDYMNFPCDFAEFDQTGQYCWITSFRDDKLYKFDTSASPWTEVSHTIPANIYKQGTSYNNTSWLVRIKGTNTGIVENHADDELVFFDLTSDTILQTISLNGTAIATDLDLGIPQAVRAGNVVYIVAGEITDNATAKVIAVNTVGQTVTSSQILGAPFLGMYDNTNFISYDSPTWFSHYAKVYGVSVLDGSHVFELTASQSGSEGFSKVGYMSAIPVNGFLWYPTKIYANWKLGRYKIPPNIEKPVPLELVGNMDSGILAKRAIVRDDGLYATFRIADSVFVTDFKEVNPLYTGASPDDLTPKAISDEWIVCNSSNLKTGLVRY